MTRSLSNLARSGRSCQWRTSARYAAPRSARCESRKCPRLRRRAWAGHRGSHRGGDGGDVSQIRRARHRDISTLSPVTLLPLAPSRADTATGNDYRRIGLRRRCGHPGRSTHVRVARRARTGRRHRRNGAELGRCQGFHEIPLDVIPGQIEAQRACHSQLSPDMPVHYTLAVIADVAMDVCSSRARLRFASSTRIVVTCRMIEKGTR